MFSPALFGNEMAQFLLVIIFFSWCVQASEHRLWPSKNSIFLELHSTIRQLRVRGGTYEQNIDGRGAPVWINTTEFRASDLGVFAKSTAQLKAPGLQQGRAFLLVRSKFDEPYKNAGVSTQLSPSDLVMVSARRDTQGTKGVAAVTLQIAHPKKSSSLLSAVNRAVCKSRTEASVGNMCVPCKPGSSSSHQHPGYCRCLAGYGAKIAVSHEEKAENIYKILTPGVSFVKRLHWLVPKNAWRTSREITIRNLGQGVRPIKIYVTGNRAKYRSRILKKINGFRQFLDVGQTTNCMPGDSIKVQIKGGDATGESDILVHIVQPQASNLGLNMPTFNTEGDGTQISTGYLLTHDGSHCEMCPLNHQSSAVNQDLPCVPSNCTGGSHYSNVVKLCLKNVCNCPNGLPASGYLCISHGMPICASCNQGFFLDSENLCASNVCKCDNGDAAAGSACLKHGGRLCARCTTHGYFFKDGQCNPWSANCSRKEIEITPPSLVNDRKCIAKHGQVGVCDEHPCTEKASRCSVHAACKESKYHCGSYSCECREGFYGNGNSCHPLSNHLRKQSVKSPTMYNPKQSGQSCKLHPCKGHPCDEHATCEESTLAEGCGSYACHCVPPFYGNGRFCKILH